jgi:PAS domain S-box-containing protein
MAEGLFPGRGSSVVLGDLDSALIDLLPAAVYVCEAPSGRVVRYNRRAAELWGRQPCLDDTEERFCGGHRLFHGDGRPLPHHETPMAEVLRSGVPARDQEVVIERPDGSRITALVNIEAIRNEKGELVGAVNVFQDISSRKESEASLKQNERWFRHLLEKLPAAAYTCDAEGLITYYNQPAVELWGREPRLNDSSDRFCGSFKLFALDGTSIQHDGCWMAKALQASEEHRGCEIIIERPDGTRVLALAHANPLYDENGNLLGAMNVLVDLTEYRSVEAELSDVRGWLEAAVNAGAVSTWLWDMKSNRLYVNPGMFQLFSVPPTPDGGEQLEAFTSAIHPDDWPRVAALLQATVEAGDDYEAEYRVVQGDGSHRWVIARGRVQHDSNGMPVRMPGVLVDITDRKLLEQRSRRLMEELRLEREESERWRRLYDTVLSGTPDLAYVFDLNHRFTYANEALLRMWGRSWSEAIGKNCLELGYEPWHAEMHDREIEQVIATRRPIRSEVPFTGTNGRRIYDYIFVPVIGANGEVEAIAGTTRDVTERKQLEQELQRRAEELAAVDKKKDEFIALLAHELRNPLAPIRNGLQIMRLAGADAPTVDEVRDMMDRQLKHLVRLVDDLLDVSRLNRNKLNLQKGPVLLSEAIHSAVETVRPAIELAGHKLEVQVPAEAILLDADITRLAQVFGNLLSNSAKYTKPGGRITLSAAKQGAQVSVSVSDTGLGIPRASLENIFDMFSQVDRSIERSSGGLGIGLALVKGLVEMHGGTITASSEGENKGSTFTVELPVLEIRGHESNGSSGDLKASPDHSRHRILVVDDNRDACRTMAMIFQLQGNHVRTAFDGMEAVEAALEFRPNVVLMDIGMPRLNGHDATRRIREQPWGKDVTIIALTGWGQEGDRDQSKAAGCNGHLVKPVNVQDLKKLLDELEHERGCLQ